MSAKQGSSRVGLILLVAAVVLAVGAWFVLRALRPVARVEPVVSGEARDAKPGSVTVRVEYSMDLQPEVAGRVLDADFTLDPGKLVTKGHILARLDGTDLQLDIEQTQNELNAAKARVAVGSSVALELAGAKDELSLQQRLFKLGQISEFEYKKAARAAEALEQKLELEKVNNKLAVETLENTLKVKERALQKMTIFAPFNGIVSDVNAHPGQEIGAGTPLARLITQHKIVEAQISEEDFANIRVGEDASVILLPYGAYVFNGKVSKILPTADPLTQRHLVQIELTDIAPEKLVPGITGDAAITIDLHHANAIVPRRALSGDSLYVVHNGRIELRKIRRGAVWQTGVEALPVDPNGPPPLVPGDLVVVDEQEKFREGDSVQVLELPSDALPKKR
jgi:RND family efflux transporter MFP subunit